jgi:hypothetical protein
MNIIIKVILITLLMNSCVMWAQSIPLESDPCWVYIESPYNYARGAVLGDVNNDGYLDLATTNEGEVNYIFINDNGVFPNTPSWQSSDAEPSWMLAFGDYDNDGDLDLAVANCAFVGGRIKLYENEDSIINPNPVWTANSKGGMWVGWADVDNDGDLDLAAVDLFQFPCVFRNNDGVLEPEPFWEASDYNIDLCGCWFDVDGDGDLDLAVGPSPETYPSTRIYYNNNGVLENTASWIAQPPDSFSVGGLAAGDVNLDGWLDLFQANGAGTPTPGNNFGYMNQNDTLELNPSWISGDVQSSTGLQFGDLDDDNFLDLACTNVGGYIVAYKNNNGGLISFPDWISNVTGLLANMVALGDIDNDGIIQCIDTLYGNGSLKLFYISHYPVHKLDSIKVDGSVVPLSDYCYIREFGWFSLKNTPTAGALITMHYSYSKDMELVTANYVFNNNIGIEEISVSSSKIPKLQVYPNPFHNKLYIAFSGGRNANNVNLKIFDVTGNLVREFNQSPFNQIVWDGKDNSAQEPPGGIYFIRLVADRFSATQKIIKLR